MFLIASCRSYRSILGPARILGRLARFAPRPVLRGMHALLPLTTPMFGDLTESQRRELVEMMKQTPPAFTLWGGAALARWTGPTDLSMPVYHVHGSADRIIPCRLVTPDLVVPGAGHLVNVTHAKEVNEFLRRFMSRRVG